MSLDRIVSLTEKLIRFRSLSGSELEVMLFMEEELTSRGWKIERIPVPQKECWNVLAMHGTPRILFTTHLDVVPAPEALFEPKISDGKLFGRGSCDAKGIAAVMVEAATSLVREGQSNIGLLFVTEEEAMSAGAKACPAILKERGVEYLIDGEPTDLCLVTGHKGMLTVQLNFAGKAAHSGYPELGEDANAKLIHTAKNLLDADWGSSERFGNGTVNLGICRGGVATNVISPSAQLKISVRTIGPNEDALSIIRECAKEADEILVQGSSERVELTTLDGFETKAVSYGTDVPHLSSCGAKCLLYGPGSIAVAHTDLEHVFTADLERAFGGYRELYQQISALL